MLAAQAVETLAAVLAPLPAQTFLDETLTQGRVRLMLDGRLARLEAFGGDPEAAILRAAPFLATKLTFHSAAPRGPAPALEPIERPDAFEAKVGAFHTAGYSVRFPELRPVLPAVDRFARALEILLHQPVTASAFWSRGEMVAPVHYDDHDLLVVQLRGEKRWFIATEPSTLPNVWKGIPAGPPQLGAHQVVDVRPGDMIYLPRGAHHTVTSVGDSFHLAIGFTPLTLRDALIAALDNLSDLDPLFRQALGVRLAPQVQPAAVDALTPRLRDGMERLIKACSSPPFVNHAFQRRASRAVAGLSPLAAPSAMPAVTDALKVRRSALATCHLSANAEKIDVSHPGGHVYIHRGVEESVRFITETPAFRVGDIPGPGGADIRASLAEKFLSIGFLEPAPELES